MMAALLQTGIYLHGTGCEDSMMAALLQTGRDVDGVGGV
jgi:hypothetical protein